jgi:lysylphosphatidylglycerol synthetase-like protein (DUF2156 family)
MIWFATIVGQLTFGLELLLFLLTTKYDYYTLVGMSVPVGFGVSSIIYFACGAVLGMTRFHTLLHTAGLFVFAYSLIGRRAFRRDQPSIRPTRQTAIFLILALAFSAAISPLMYRTSPRTFQTSFSGDIHE